MKMKKKSWYMLIVAIVLILASAYLFWKFYFPFQNDSSQIANPASVYCEENGGILDIRTNEEGQYGVCIKDGKECEEWAFYRGECTL